MVDRIINWRGGCAVKRSAVISPDRRYRYSLFRSWDESLPTVLFIGLNPSTADETKDDPTIRRCINFAKAWGFGSLYMANLFAFRATQPNEMKMADNPIGLHNNKTLIELSRAVSLTVAVWSKDGSFKNRDQVVKSMISNLHILKLNKDGSPSHPLYLKKSLIPQSWNCNV